MNIRYKVFKYIMTPMKRSIRFKLLMMIMIVAIGPLIVAAMISSQNSRSAMEKEILRQNNLKMEWVVNEFNYNVDRIDETLTAFYFDDNVLFYSTKLNDNDSLQTLGITYFRNKLKTYLLSNFRDFDSVGFYMFEEQRYFEASRERDFSASFIPEDELESNPLFHSTDNLFYTLEQVDDKTLVDGPFITKLFKRFDDQKTIGALVVKMNWLLFDKAYELLNVDKGNQIFFTNKRGEVIYNPDRIKLDYSYRQMLFKEMDLYSEKNYFLNGDQYIFFKQLSEDLFIFKTIPTSIANDFYRDNLYSQLAIIVLTGLLIISMTIFLGSYLTKPIVTLTKSMQDVERILEGEVIPEAKVKSNDEIKVLEQSYLFMLRKIKDLIDEEYKLKIESQSAQLMALQAQINPHFMYNTLQMIGALAIEKDSMEIYDIITAFSKMSRYNMQLSEELVTIDQELTNVSHYMQIQQMRFDNKVIMHLDVDEVCLDYRIPKLTLQPIIENCFKHGFTKTTQEWTIELTTRIVENHMIITILDNGQGVSREKLEMIRLDLEKSTSSIFKNDENLGLKNIDSRIKIHYGFGNGLSIDSEYEHGTKISIRIGLKQ